MFIQCLLTVYYVPGTSVNKIEQSPSQRGLHPRERQTQTVTQHKASGADVTVVKLGCGGLRRPAILGVIGEWNPWAGMNQKSLQTPVSHPRRDREQWEAPPG